MSGGNPVETVVTDSEGKATFLHQETESGTKQYYVELQNTDTTDVVVFDVVDVSYLEMSVDKDIISDGQIATITAKAMNGTDPIPNIAINIGLETFVSDENGEVTMTYEGSGAGIVHVNGKCGDVTSMVLIEDVLMYYSQSTDTIMNLNYTLQNSLSVLYRYNGLQLTSYNANKQTSDGHIYFTYPNSKSENWIFEFEVVSVQAGSNLQVTGTFLTYNQISNKPRISVVVRDGVKKVFVNENQVSSSTNSAYFVPSLVVTGNIIIDNIKIVKEIVQ